MIATTRKNANQMVFTVMIICLQKKVLKQIFFSHPSRTQFSGKNCKIDLKYNTDGHHIHWGCVDPYSASPLVNIYRSNQTVEVHPGAFCETIHSWVGYVTDSKHKPYIRVTCDVDGTWSTDAYEQKKCPGPGSGFNTIFNENNTVLQNEISGKMTLRQHFTFRVIQLVHILWILRSLIHLMDLSFCAQTVLLL